MNRGVLQSHGWWSINTSMRPPTSHHQQAGANSSSSSPFMAAPPPPPTTFFPHFTPPPLPFSSSSSSSSSSWSDTHHPLPPSDSWSQLLLGGLVDEEDKSGLTANMEAAKKLENWEEQLLGGHGGPTTFDDTKHQESSCYNVYGPNAEFAVAKQPNNNNNNWSQSSSPTSCVTTLSCASNMLDSCNNKIVMSDNATRHPPPDHSSECNSTGTTGGAPKKPRVQPSSTTQSTFKVRKEKLGDRITALHQLVSPFGKTDTASVLLEAIGYIRFLQSQIEALSLPYLGTATETMRHHQPPVVQGERNSLFPEDPGQLLNDNCMKRKGISHHQDLHDESKKDLRSRGLCLVPISCTLQVGNDNGADYWAPAAFGGGFR
ncbi:PREDICTED: transcription factor bHLH68-like [Ipomoea nil]|uniref:transcription factor bHLH68-like n=1 Tax=Ipomoea nil TaxID=35883 RepID=UPI0009016808|nr:PREDICTED: transcription factor bHLH68-like [Ipomoea nil]